MNNVVIGIAFLGCAVYLFYQAFVIGSKKQIEKISCINKVRIKKITNRDQLAKDYSNILKIMAVGALVGAILAIFVSVRISYIALFALIWGSFMLSGFNANIDEKIKNKVY